MKVLHHIKIYKRSLLFGGLCYDICKDMISKYRVKYLAVKIFLFHFILIILNDYSNGINYHLVS